MTWQPLVRTTPFLGEVQVEFPEGTEQWSNGVRGAREVKAARTANWVEA